MSTEKRIIEVSGVKLEVDMTQAKRIDTFRVGSPIKLLKKELYSTRYETFPGVIVGFTNFKEQPAIDVLYISDGYGTPTVKFIAVTENSEEIEIAHLSPYEIVLDRDTIGERLDRDVESKLREYEVALARRDTFHKHFGEAFAQELEALKQAT